MLNQNEKEKREKISRYLLTIENIFSFVWKPKYSNLRSYLVWNRACFFLLGYFAGYNFTCWALGMAWSMCRTREGGRICLPWSLLLLQAGGTGRPAQTINVHWWKERENEVSHCRLLDCMWWRGIVSSCSICANTHPRTKPYIWWHPQQRHDVPPLIPKPAPLAGQLGLVLMKWFYGLNSLL